MPLDAAPLIDDGMRELERLRLRQLQTVQGAGELAAFTTDGCSGNLSSGWRLLAASLPGFADGFGDRPPWEDCCVAHDRSYWRGGAIDGYASRLRADEALRKCVLLRGNELAPALAARHSVGEARVRQTFALIADLMYDAVRFGGQPCTLLPWRWGYGWPRCAFAEIEP